MTRTFPTTLGYWPSREYIGDARSRETWSVGRGITLDHAIDFALASID